MNQQEWLFSGLLLGFLVLPCWGDEPTKPRISEGKKDDNGILIHTIECEYQDKGTTLRVLLPTKMEKEKRYPVVYVLPVEAGNGTQFGDGMVEVKKLGLADKHGVIFVQPTFARLPWYADHPKDKGIRQEAYLLKVVVPFVEDKYPSLVRSDGRLLLGFSKSGWGAFTLLLRHPDVFGRAAGWDAPFAMDKPGKYGNGPIFGDDNTFQQYSVSKLLEQQAKKLGDKKRLAVLGYGNFRQDHKAIHDVMERLKIPHEYKDGPERKHDWHSGWVAEAVEFLTAP